MIAQQDSIYVAEDTLITSKLLNDASDTRTLSKSSSGRIHSLNLNVSLMDGSLESVIHGDCVTHKVIYTCTYPMLDCFQANPLLPHDFFKSHLLLFYDTVLFFTIL